MTDTCNNLQDSYNVERKKPDEITHDVSLHYIKSKTAGRANVWHYKSGQKSPLERKRGVTAREGSGNVWKHLVVFPFLDLRGCYTDVFTL